MKIKLLLIVLAFQFGFAQERNCGVVQKKIELENNPTMHSKYEKNKALSEIELNRLVNNQANGITQRAGEIHIPVAVHYTGANSATPAQKDCLRALAQNQVDILNADFNGTNSDISIWNNTTKTYFPGVNNGSLNVIFEIATQNHPAGMGLVNGDKAITFGIRFGGGPDGDWDPDWAGYLNLVVENLSGSTLGYAYLGSSPADGAAVYIDAGAFGSGAGCTGYVPGAPYNLGRTLTHELGHYLNLEHIWGDANCGNDFVADTPLHNASNFGCPATGHLSTCAGTPRELTMNYMDYTNDVCMYMLTAGQAQRAQAHLNVIQPAFNLNTLSRNDYAFEKSISLFPNPSKGSFTIQFPEVIGNYSVQVLDQSARLVYTNEFTNSSNLSQTVNLNSAATGVYFVKIKADNSIAIKKIVIE
ncbi:MAG: zinc-dependent metalloprotease [Bacteroidota bacterium]